MIRRVHIDSMEGIKDLLFEQERNRENGRLRSSFFYRGMLDADFDLTTSLQRNCGSRALFLESALLESYIRYAKIENPTVDESIWKAMMIGQHHGLPTRLLDWSHSTLVALHFATTENDFRKIDRRDGVVWRMDARELNARLPEKYRQVLEEKQTFIFSATLLNQVVADVAQYDLDMGDRAMVTLEPPSIDQRIVNQYSFFTVIPSGIADLEQYLERNTEHTVKYVIDKGLRWDLRDTLDQLNMNERMIYPGQDGIARWLARHYYVRE